MIEWFTTWRWRLWAGGGAAIAIGLSALRLIAMGRQQERDAAALRRAENIAKAKEITDEVRSLSRADLDRRLSQWVRDRG